MLPCTTCRDQLLDHLYGLLDPADAAAVEAHLAACPACAAERDLAARWQGLIATAARGSFPEAKFAPPTEPKADPAVEPARLDPAEGHRSVTATWARWVVAAGLLLAFAGLGGPTARDLTGHLLYYPKVNRELAAVGQARAEKERVTREIAQAKERAIQRAEETKAKYDAIVTEWVTAETKALEDAANRPFHVTVRGPAAALPGAPNDYAVQVTDKNGRPKKVALDAQVKDAAGRVVFARKLDVDKTAAEHTLRLPADVWAGVPTGTDLTLHVAATDPAGGEKTEVRETVRLQEPLYTTFLTTDKPMYRPGEPVYFRSLTLDRTRLTPPDREMNLRFELKAPSGQRVPGMELVGLAKPATRAQNGRFEPVLSPDGKLVRGVGSGAFALPPTLDGGEYTLTVTEVSVNETHPRGNVRPLAVRKLIVNKYTPDKLDKKLEFDAKTYGPGDAVQAKIEVRDQAKPLAGAALQYAVEADGVSITPDVAPPATDAQGTASIRFTLPKTDEIKEARLTVTVRTAAIVEPLVRRVPLASRKLTVEFFPEGGDLVAGAECRVYFRATTTTGKPADVQGVLTDGTMDIAPVRTLTDADHPGVNQGLGAFTFTPEAGKKYAVKLDKPVGIVQPDGGYPLPEARKGGVVLRVADEVTRPGQKVRVQLRSAGGKRPVLVGAYIRGRAVAHQTTTLEPGRPTDLALELGDTKLGGVTRITVFEQPDGDGKDRADLKPVAERLVYRQPGEVLKLGFTTSKPGAGPVASFIPGDRVQLDLTARNEQDQPTAAVLWAAVVNQSVLTMADEKAARLVPTHFLLAGEVQNPDDLEHADFLLTDHPKAAVALDLLLGTQGWRRFAEQAPELFRRKFQGGEADHLLVASAGLGAVPAGWRDPARKVADEFWPRYEAARLDLDAAEATRQAGTVPGDLPTDLARAEAEHQTRLTRFGEAAGELKFFDDSVRGRREWLPFTMLVTVGAAVVFAVGWWRRTPGDPVRRPFALGAVGFALLAVFMTGGVAVTGVGNPRWRSAAAGLPQMQQHYPYVAGGVAPPQTAAATRAPAAAPVEMADGGAKNLWAEGGDAAEDDRFDFFFRQPPAPDAAGAAMDFAPPPAAAPAARGAARRFAAPAERLAEDRAKLALGLGDQAGALAGDLELGLLREQQGQANGRFLDLDPERAGRPNLARRQRVGERFGLEGVPDARLERELQKNLEAVRELDAKALKDLAKHTQLFSLAQAARQKVRASIPRTRPLVVRQYAHARVTPQLGSDETRTDFTETLLWHPVIVTPQDGKATVSFDLSDAVAAYQVLVAGHTLDGRVGAVKGTIEVRKPFAVDPKLPPEISSSDRPDVPVVLTNGTDAPRAAGITLTLNGLTAESDRLSAAMTPNGGGRAFVRLTPTKSEGPLSVKLVAKAGDGLTDSVERTGTVVPDGFPLAGSKSDTLERLTRAPVNLPATWIPGTLKVAVTVYPNTLSELQAGLDGLLREPHGCFEQTSTANYPNVLILSYLNETNQAKPDVAKRARELMDRGYARLTGYECPKTGSDARKGYEWFGAPDRPHEALTAYGVLQFTDMSRVYPVDPTMLARTKQFLIDSRDGRGGFKKNSAAIDGFGRAPGHVTNAYIVWAISESEKGSAEPADLSKEVEALFALATKADGKPAKDPYFLALVANALINRGRTNDGLVLLKVVAGMQAKDGSVPGAETSITTSSGRDLLIETTAFAVLGWLKANRPDLFLASTQAAMGWVGKQRSGGSFGSTQATILALKALIEHARANKRPAESGELRVFVGGKEVGKTAFTTDAAGPIVVEVPDAEKAFKPGETEVRVETTAKQAYPMSVAWSCRTVKPNSSPECAVKVAAKLARPDVTEGESVRLDVRVANTADKAHGMVVAVVGLPAGLKLPEDMKQLKELTAIPKDGTEPTVSYWETRGRELVLYWRGMAPKQVVSFGLDLIADVPGEYRGPASRAYLYYNADHKHWAEPVGVTIRTKAGEQTATR